MAGRRPQIIIADTSVLINFLRIDATNLLGQLSSIVRITEHVESEVTDNYEDQRECLDAALRDGHVAVATLTSHEELEAFARLVDSGRLGSGECAAIACASVGRHTLAIDDRRAIAEAQKLDAALPVMRTVDLVVMMIREGLLSVAEADTIKSVWENEHRFRLTFASFADIIEPQP